MSFDTNSIRGSNAVDSVCDFESVPPDQLYEETNRFTRFDTDPCSYARVLRLRAMVRVRGVILLLGKYAPLFVSGSNLGLNLGIWFELRVRVQVRCRVWFPLICKNTEALGLPVRIPVQTIA